MTEYHQNFVDSFANLNEFLGNPVEGLVTLEREGVANDSRAG